MKVPWKWIKHNIVATTNRKKAVRHAWCIFHRKRNKRIKKTYKNSHCWRLIFRFMCFLGKSIINLMCDAICDIIKWVAIAPLLVKLFSSTSSYPEVLDQQNLKSSALRLSHHYHRHNGACRSTVNTQLRYIHACLPSEFSILILVSIYVCGFLMLMPFLCFVLLYTQQCAAYK